MINEHDIRDMMPDELKKDLESGKEVVGEFMSFLDANIKDDIEEEGIVIYVSDRHMTAFCDLLNAVQAWSGFSRAPIDEE